MQAYFILDELLLAGELQESSKRAVGRMIAIHVSITVIYIVFTFIIGDLKEVRPKSWMIKLHSEPKRVVIVISTYQQV